jgi:NCAIR mutase (PurE)-related protein
MEAVGAGEVTPDEAVAQLRRLPFTDLGFARVDHHRALRQGRAETVYGPGKAPEHVAAIVTELLGASGAPILVSRVDDEQAVAALTANPGGSRHGDTLVWRPRVADPSLGTVALVTAGTADLPVADECATTLIAHGIEPARIDDVGVAGLHRLLAVLDDVLAADVVIVVAGMEGALASVVGGLVAAPVVAVPTSVGYGSSLEGVTALLGMLASCASGITVVGIDNGFGAATAALRVLDVRRARAATVAPSNDGRASERRTADGAVLSAPASEQPTIVPIGGHG